MIETFWICLNMLLSSWHLGERLLHSVSLSPWQDEDETTWGHPYPQRIPMIPNIGFRRN